MKPILFNTEMVKAILEGRKTQTRRAIKDAYAYDVEVDGSLISKEDAYGDHYSPQDWAPYKVGDVLYVRETFYRLTKYHYNYRADYPSEMAKTYVWHPSIHMPKEAARLFLQVTNVRAERLQDISDSDIKAEGLSEVCSHCYHYNGDCKDFVADADCKLRAEWGRLWDSTVKPIVLNSYGWDANPYVLVYEFERISKEEATK